MVTVKRKAGFSLIEVNLAIFIISIGMLTLFSLFPMGLRQVGDANAATQEALFADYVLSTIRAEARLLNSEDWLDMTEFKNAVLENLPVQNNMLQTQRIEFGTAGQFMRFQIDIEPAGNTRRVIRLWCKFEEFGATGSNFRTHAARFYTEVFYSGMP
jgi:prepilin-type N-terminal cleavage/methylation domain-containing protein